MRYRIASSSPSSGMKKILRNCAIIFLAAVTTLALRIPGQSVHDSAARWGYLLEGSVLLKGGDAGPRERISGYEVICHTGYVLDRGGKLVRTPEERNALKKLIPNTAEYVPMIGLRSASEGRAMLASPAARFLAAKELAGLIEGEKFKVLHLDFEYLPPEDAPRLAEFLKTLRATCRGARLSMAVFPQIEFPREKSGFHELSVIAPCLDEIVLMCYDLHGPGTKPGPVTDIGWSERNIAHALKFLNPRQVWLGVPAYGYRWEASGRSAAVSARSGVKEALRCISERHGSGTLYYECRGARGARRAWIADRHTRAMMEDLAVKYGLRGTAMWRLGLEE